MTEIYCRSDCEFAMNNERHCLLKMIQLTQTDEASPKFVCANYVRSTKLPNRYATIDMEISRNMGAERGIREILG